MVQFVMLGKLLEHLLLLLRGRLLLRLGCLG